MAVSAGLASELFLDIRQPGWAVHTLRRTLPGAHIRLMGECMECTEGEAVSLECGAVEAAVGEGGKSPENDEKLIL